MAYCQTKEGNFAPLRFLSVLCALRLTCFLDLVLKWINRRAADAEEAQRTFFTNIPRSFRQLRSNHPKNWRKILAG